MPVMEDCARDVRNLQTFTRLLVVFEKAFVIGVNVSGRRVGDPPYEGEGHVSVARSKNRPVDEPVHLFKRLACTRPRVSGVPKPIPVSFRVRGPAVSVHVPKPFVNLERLALGTQVYRRLEELYDIISVKLGDGILNPISIQKCNVSVYPRYIFPVLREF